MGMAFVMTSMNASASMTLVVSATVLEKFTSADVQTSQRVTAIVMGTNLTHLAFAEALAQLMSTRMASAMTLMNASAPTTLVVSATVPEKSMNADVQTFLKETAIATATSWTFVGIAAAGLLVAPTGRMQLRLRACGDDGSCEFASLCGLHGCFCMQLRQHRDD